jgi:hypothetical protein
MGRRAEETTGILLLSAVPGIAIPGMLHFGDWAEAKPL